MTGFIDAINDAIVGAAEQPWVLLALVAFCLVDGFFPPVPSESLVIGLAVVSASTGTPAWPLIVLAGALGAFLGDNLSYQIGRTVGVDRIPWLRTPRAQAGLAGAAEALRRRGAVIVVTARHVPVGRVAVTLTAGATGMRRSRFMVLTLISATIWAGLGVAVGTFAAHWVEDNALVGVALGIGVALVLGFTIDRVLAALEQRREAPAALEEEMPADGDRPVDQGTHTGDEPATACGTTAPPV